MPVLIPFSHGLRALWNMNIVLPWIVPWYRREHWLVAIVNCVVYEPDLLRPGDALIEDCTVDRPGGIKFAVTTSYHREYDRWGRSSSCEKPRRRPWMPDPCYQVGRRVASAALAFSWL